MEALSDVRDGSTGEIKKGEDTMFMLELRECSKRIYDISNFIFYAMGYITKACPFGNTLQHKIGKTKR
ncbi:hypothetical protein D7V86_12180 [bacterium D16-51]|nr:hypothetical protein D7V96_13105 [bacterium D16-59]RKI59618.1 hypothetical protein D7V86_12180 [bacterium D16-51]